MENYVKFSQLTHELRRMKRPLLTLDEMILLLLYTHKDKPIITRTLLFKELFLLYEEILKKYIDKKEMPDPVFIPYKYGPFSFPLSETLSSLITGGLVKVLGRAKGRDEEFMLTHIGENIVEKIIEDLPSSIREKLLEEITFKRIGWDQLGRDGILKYVYRKYKEYTPNSEIIEKYKGVEWGVFEE